MADARPDFDRQHQGGFYSRAGGQDYWIVKLIDRVLEVYRDPAPELSAPSGWRYRLVETLTALAVVVPLALPSTQIAVADLLA